MMNRAKEIALLSVVGFFLLVVGVAIFGNLKGFQSSVNEIAVATWHGIIILFFTGLGLGVLYAVVRIRQMSKVRVIGPTKHGPAQALIVQERKGLLQVEQRIEQLAAPNMDPRQQLEMLQKVMQVANTTAMSDQRIMAMLAKQQKQLQIAAPQQQEEEDEEDSDAIPPIVRYEDVADEIPAEMSLLGIHPENGRLELTLWEKLKCLWIVGSSSSGKSNTVYGKAREAKEKGAWFLVVDQHIIKPDSLGRKMMEFAKVFLRPIAVSDDDVLATLQWFKTEFERRVNCPVCAHSNEQCTACSQKIVLICDEMNRMNRNERLRKPLQEVVAICGEESRGFGMYGWFLSQKCAHLKWLRDSAITVIVHRLTRLEEAKLACNDDLAAARRLLTFKVGRTYVYGVDFDEPMELQQALYPTPKDDHPATYPGGESNTDTLLPYDLPNSSIKNAEVYREVNGEVSGSDTGENLEPTNLSTIKELREIGKRLKKGEDPAQIVKSYGLPYGRATQELSAVVNMMAQQIDMEIAQRDEEL